MCSKINVGSNVGWRRSFIEQLERGSKMLQSSRQRLRPLARRLISQLALSEQFPRAPSTASVRRFQ